MNALVSKIQYINCEPGEFKDEQSRSLEEVIEIIEKFPWEQQRKNLRVSPTNPSVTLQSSRFEYLKLALYLSFSYLKSFYDSGFDPVDFKSESRWFHNYSIHFTSREFKYFINGDRIRSFLISTSGINFGLGIFILILMLAPHRVVLSLPAILSLSTYGFLMGGGLNLILFFNYYRYVKDKTLIMSKGEEVFYFGQAENPDRYEKKEITGIIVYGARGSRSPIVLFRLAEIEFEKKANIFIPGLLLTMEELVNKLSDYPVTNKDIGWPAIRIRQIELAG